MELLRGTAPTATFDTPAPDTEITTVMYSVNGAEPLVVPPVAIDGGWEVQLPYIGAETNTVEVQWSFTIPNIAETFKEVFAYEAVSPYLSKSELVDLLGDEDLTDAQMWKAEAAARHVINAHTGQKFGFDRSKAIRVEGHGEKALRLPERLVSVKGVNTLTDSLGVSAFIIVSDGWYLKKAWADATPLLEPEGSQYWGDYPVGNIFDNHIYSDPDGDGLPPLIGPLSSRPGGVTVTPRASGHATVWKDDYPFVIVGDWGYKSVPAPVKEAARLLISDYACGEAGYRDKYLDSIRAADWRLEYSSRAWNATGNARADQLLSEFVLLDWAVI